MIPTATRPDASLSLLQRIVDGSLDPTYAQVAEGRPAGRGDATPWRRSGFAVAGVLLALGALTAAAVAQTWRQLPDTQRSRNALAERAAEAAATNDRQAARVADLAGAVGVLRAEALSGAGLDSRLEARLSTLSAATGVSALTGPGVRLVLDDGPPARADGVGPDLARVLDRDLQLAVNGLFEAGAEAVEVNGQRITALTAIRSAGEAVLVGFRPLTRPYVVTAIGDPLDLEVGFVNSASGRELATLAATYRMRFDIEGQESVTVGAEAVPLLRYAEAQEE